MKNVHKHIQMLVMEAEEGENMYLVMEGKREASRALGIFQLLENLVTKEEIVQQQGRRMKRNILGDIISSITGLATTETITRQIRYDKDLRTRIEKLMRAQQEEVNGLERVMSNITMDEEALHDSIVNIQQRHNDDVRRAAKHRLRMSLVEQDIDMLHDIVLSMFDGTTSPEQTARFSARISTTSMPHYRLHNITQKQGILIANYIGTLYRQSPVMATAQMYGVWQVRTDRRTYIMQSAPLQNAQLDDNEAIMVGGICDTCALLTHIGHGVYFTVKAGTLQCTESENNTQFMQGSTVFLGTSEQCSNEIMHIRTSHYQAKTYSINMAEDSAMEEAILARAMQEQVHLEGKNEQKVRHTIAQQIMHKDIIEAKQRMVELSAWAEETEKNILTTGDDTWQYGILGAVMAMLVLSVLGCCMRRHIACMMGKHNKDATHGEENGGDNNEGKENTK